MKETIQQLDFSLLYSLRNAIQCPLLDFLMPKITMLGNGGCVWLAAAFLLLLQPKHHRTGILLLVGLAAGVLIGNVVMKPLFARPRPCWLDTTVEMLVAVPRDFSFPSGHTLSSVIAATILSLAEPRFAIVAIPLAALIALSRLYLFVHFPTDILASVVIGIVVGVLVWKYGGLLLHPAECMLRHRRES